MVIHIETCWLLLFYIVPIPNSQIFPQLKARDRHNKTTILKQLRLHSTPDHTGSFLFTQSTCTPAMFLLCLLCYHNPEH